MNLRWPIIAGDHPPGSFNLQDTGPTLWFFFAAKKTRRDEGEKETFSPAQNSGGKRSSEFFLNNLQTAGATTFGEKKVPSRRYR